MYTPQDVPADAGAIPAYLSRELNALAQSLQLAQEFAYLKTINVAPKKPREGMVAKADGTNWNPGSGAGLYGYIGGAWTFLGGGTGTVTHTAGALAAGLVVVGNGAADLKTLAASTDLFVLTQVAGIAAWAAASGGVTYGLLINTLQQPQTL